MLQHSMSKSLNEGMHRAKKHFLHTDLARSV